MKTKDEMIWDAAVAYKARDYTDSGALKAAHLLYEEWGKQFPAAIEQEYIVETVVAGAQSLTPITPQWSVGDYAQAQDGTIRRVVSIHKSGISTYHDGHMGLFSALWEKVPEPPMPKLPSRIWTIHSESKLCRHNTIATIDGWIAMIEVDAHLWGTTTLDALKKLRDWCKLTGKGLC